MSARPPARLNHRHSAMISFMLLHPECSQREMAAALGYTEAWVSTVVRSDLFQSRLQELQSEQHALASETTMGRLDRVAHKALDNMDRMLDGPGGIMPEVVLKAADVTLKALIATKYKPATAGGGAVNINMNVSGPSPEVFTRARSIIESQSE